MSSLYSPTNPGWGAVATVAKKKPKPQKPPTVGAADPYDAATIGGYTVPQLAKMTPQQIASIQATLTAQGPDTSSIPFDKLQAYASDYAQQSYDQQAAPYLDLRDRNLQREKLSREAATNFGAAMALVFQGGLGGQEGMDYALKNYGSSYAGMLAARMGQELILQQADYFNSQDAEIASKLSDLLDKMPEERDKVYQDLVNQGMDGVLNNHKNALAALAALMSAAKDRGGGGGAPETKNFSDGTTRQYNPKTGKWDVVTSKKTDAGDGGPQIVYANGVPYYVDPVTRKAQPVVPGTGTAKGAKSAATKAASSGGKSERIYGNSETGYYYIRNGKKVPIPGTGASASGAGGPGVSSGESASTQSNTVKRAADAGEAALAKVTDNIWAKMPGSGAEEGTPEYAKAEAAYNAWLDSGKSFGTAMQRVIVAIAPHLKAIGYTRAQIKLAAYQIVSAELDPPKGYKPPKASAARVAANTQPSVKPVKGALVPTWTGSNGTHVTDNLDLNHGAKTAIDIMAAPGTPVAAPASGTVVRLGSAQGGDSMYFRDDDGYMWWLGHIDSRYSLPPGTRVAKGQTLSRISADHAAPHLHIDRTLAPGGSYS